MKRKTRRIWIVLAAAVFVVSSGVLLHRELQYRQGEHSYEEAMQLAHIPALNVPEPNIPEQNIAEPLPQTEPVPQQDPYAALLSEVDFAGLREVNEDVVGWIAIPNTNLSYPLVRGGDNDYYLNHTWRGEWNAVGAIFMDYRNSRDLSDFHTVIFGHRMNNESMFGQLHKYKEAGYWESHPNLYIADDSGIHVYQIFSIYEADTLNTYQMEFSGDLEKQEFIDYCLSKSLIDTGVEPGVGDRVITLSTCTGNGYATRWVVQAVEKE